MVIAELVNDFSAQCSKILSCSAVNLKRRQKGKPPANCLLVRDGGSKYLTMPSTQEKYQRTTAIYGQLPCEQALAELIGASFHYTQAFELQIEATYLRRLPRACWRLPPISFFAT